MVITGASSGIGRAAAIRFSRESDTYLVLAARREHELQITLDACGGADSGRIYPCDLSGADGVEALAASIAEIEGACDVLVNNAGIGCRRPYDGPDVLADMEHVMSLNLLGPMRLTAHLLPLLRASPRAAIVNVSSVAGLVGTPNAPIYCASKFGLTGWSEALHAGLAGDNIHVAWVQPGPVVTEGWAHSGLAGLPRPLRRLLVAPVDSIARAIVRGADRRGTPSPILPRTYRLLVAIGVVAPPVGRWLLRRGARSGTTDT